MQPVDVPFCVPVQYLAAKLFAAAHSSNLNSVNEHASQFKVAFGTLHTNDTNNSDQVAQSVQSIVAHLDKGTHANFQVHELQSNGKTRIRTFRATRLFPPANKQFFQTAFDQDNAVFAAALRLVEHAATSVHAAAAPSETSAGRRVVKEANGFCRITYFVPSRSELEAVAAFFSDAETWTENLLLWSQKRNLPSLPQTNTLCALLVGAARDSLPLHKSITRHGDTENYRARHSDNDDDEEQHQTTFCSATGIDCSSSTTGCGAIYRAFLDRFKATYDAFSQESVLSDVHATKFMKAFGYEHGFPLFRSGTSAVELQLAEKNTHPHIKVVPQQSQHKNSWFVPEDPVYERAARLSTSTFENTKNLFKTDDVAELGRLCTAEMRRRQSMTSSEFALIVPTWTYKPHELFMELVTVQVETQPGQWVFAHGQAHALQLPAACLALNASGYPCCNLALSSTRNLPRKPTSFVLASKPPANFHSFLCAQHGLSKDLNAPAKLDNLTSTVYNLARYKNRKHVVLADLVSETHPDVLITCAAYLNSGMRPQQLTDEVFGPGVFAVVELGLLKNELLRHTNKHLGTADVRGGGDVDGDNIDGGGGIDGGGIDGDNIDGGGIDGGGIDGGGIDGGDFQVDKERCWTVVSGQVGTNTHAASVKAAELLRSKLASTSVQNHVVKLVEQLDPGFRPPAALADLRPLVFDPSNECVGTDHDLALLFFGTVEWRFDDNSNVSANDQLDIQNIVSKYLGIGNKFISWCTFKFVVNFSVPAPHLMHVRVRLDSDRAIIERFRPSFSGFSVTHHVRGSNEATVVFNKNNWTNMPHFNQFGGRTQQAYKVYVVAHELYHAVGIRHHVTEDAYAHLKPDLNTPLAILSQQTRPIFNKYGSAPALVAGGDKDHHLKNTAPFLWDVFPADWSHTNGAALLDFSGGALYDGTTPFYKDQKQEQQDPGLVDGGGSGFNNPTALTSTMLSHTNPPHLHQQAADVVKSLLELPHA
jgi:hypothetical protein